MAIFNYAILTPDRQVLSGSLELDCMESALLALESGGGEILSLIEVLEQTEHDDANKINTRSLELLSKLKQYVSSEMNQPRLIECLDDIHASVSGGASLPAAIQKHRENLPEEFRAIFHQGYSEHMLQRIILRLINQLQHANSLRRQATVMITGSILSVIVLLSLIFFILGYVVPLLAEVLKGLHLPVSPGTSILLNFSEFIGRHLLISFEVLFGIILVLSFLLLSPFFDRLRLRIFGSLPGIGASLRKIQIARVMMLSATFLRSGAAFSFAGHAGKGQDTSPILDQPDIVDEVEYERLLRENGLVTQADMARLRVSKNRQALATVIGTLTNRITERAESGFNKLLFTMLESAIGVIFVITILLFILVVILPLFAIVESIRKGI